MIDKLLKYIEKNNYIGYDPYDLKGKKWYINLDNNLRNEFDRLNFLYPKELRKLFSIKPKLNNKALALIALSYINLNQIKKAIVQPTNKPTAHKLNNIFTYLFFCILFPLY